MEAKRLLKWEAAIDGIGKPCLRAQTKLVTCDVYDDHSWCVYDIEGGEADSQEAALDACEAAYIKLCTEFLSMYNPATHVVVSRGAAKVAEVMEDCVSRQATIDDTAKGE